MRKYKQIIMAIIIAAALVTLSWFAGSSRKDIDTIEVVSISADIRAGTRIEAEYLDYIEITDASYRETYFQDIQEVLGQWLLFDLKQGEILTRNRLDVKAAGIDYPGSAPGRRLMTVRLSPAEANGFWLAEGNRVDLYLVPRNTGETETRKIPDLEIVRLIKPASSPEQLICLDISRKQADFLADYMERCTVRVAVINE